MDRGQARVPADIRLQIVSIRQKYSGRYRSFGHGLPRHAVQRNVAEMSSGGKLDIIIEQASLAAAAPTVPSKNGPQIDRTAFGRQLAV